MSRRNEREDATMELGDVGISGIDNFYSEAESMVGDVVEAASGRSDYEAEPMIQVEESPVSIVNQREQIASESEELTRPEDIQLPDQDVSVNQVVRMRSQPGSADSDTDNEDVRLRRGSRSKGLRRKRLGNLPRPETRSRNMQIERSVLSAEPRRHNHTFGKIHYKDTSGLKSWGFNSVYGANAFDFEAKSRIENPEQVFFRMVERRMHAARAEMQFQVNRDIIISSQVAVTTVGQHIRHQRRELRINWTRNINQEPVFRFDIHFGNTSMITQGDYEKFSLCFKNNLLDERVASNQVGGVLGVPRIFAQQINPVLTMGLGRFDVVGYFATGWILLIHRLWFDVSNIQPIPAPADRHHVGYANLDAIGNDQRVAAESFKDAVSNGYLVLRAVDYSNSDLAVAYWIANSLPVFQTPLRYARACWLDSFHVPPQPMLIAYHGVMPEQRPNLPTSGEIRRFMLHIANLRGLEYECLCGFMRASAYGFRFPGPDNNVMRVNAFGEWQHAVWYLPRWENPFVQWLFASPGTRDTSITNELNAAVSGTGTKLILRMTSFAALVGVSVGTLMQRWAITGNILNLYPGVGIGNIYGAWTTFFQRRIGTTESRVVSSIFTSILNVMTRLGCGGFKTGFLMLPGWENEFNDYAGPILPADGWRSGWLNRIFYPANPLDILWIVEFWPSIWGLMKPPIIFNICEEVSLMVQPQSNRFVPLLGDDIFKSIPKKSMIIAYTPYTALLLNTLSQHCQLQELPQFRWRLTDTQHRDDNDIHANTIIPAPIYNIELLCLEPGTLWFFDWASGSVLSPYWRLNEIDVTLWAILTIQGDIHALAGFHAGSRGQALDEAGAIGWEDEEDTVDVIGYDTR